MADRAFENATSRRDELARSINRAQQSLDEMRQELRLVDVFLEQWKRFAETPDFELVAHHNLLGGVTLAPVRGEKNSKKEEVAEAALEIIAKAGEPVSRSNLLTLLMNRGLRIKGGDPEVVLSTMLWRMRNKVVRLRKGGYWDAALPSPDGSYIPGLSNDEDHIASMTRDEAAHAIGGLLENDEET